MRWMAATAAILVSLGAAARAEVAERPPARIECARPSSAELGGGRLVCDVVMDLRGAAAPERRREAEVVEVPKRGIRAMAQTEIVAPAVVPTLGVWSGAAVLRAQAACDAAYPEVVDFPRLGAKPARRALPTVVEPQAPACARQG